METHHNLIIVGIHYEPTIISDNECPLQMNFTVFYDKKIN